MMYKREELQTKTTKQLLDIAKEMSIVGRHSMRKNELINAIVDRQELVSASEGRILNGEPTQQGTPAGILNRLEHELASAGHDEVWEELKTTPSSNLPRPKEEYIENAKIGTIIAFKVNNVKVISGMIEEIHKSDFLVRTKSGVKFTVRKKNIVWVKTGPRWPKGVYLALKGEAPDGKCQATN